MGDDGGLGSDSFAPPRYHRRPVGAVEEVEVVEAVTTAVMGLCEGRAPHRERKAREEMEDMTPSWFLLANEDRRSKIIVVG